MSQRILAPVAAIHTDEGLTALTMAIEGKQEAAALWLLGEGGAGTAASSPANECSKLMGMAASQGMVRLFQALQKRMWVAAGGDEQVWLAAAAAAAVTVDSSPVKRVVSFDSIVDPEEGSAVHDAAVAGAARAHVQQQQQQQQQQEEEEQGEEEEEEEEEQEPSPVQGETAVVVAPWPLHAACQRGNEETASFLIFTGAFDPLEPDDMGFLPQHYAAGYGHLSLLQSMLSRFALPVDAAAPCGYTALHAAAIGSRLETVQWLVGAGADVFAARQCPDGQPRRASELAFGSGQGPVGMYLRGRGKRAEALQWALGGPRQKQQQKPQ